MNIKQQNINQTLGFHFFVQPTEAMITKRRRLSEQSISNDSTGDRQLNDSFKRMEIQGTNLSSVSLPLPLQENYVTCPKPVRLISQALIKQKEQQPQLKNTSFQSILLDQLGIQKYLTLDCDLKINDIKAKQFIKQNESIKRSRPPPMYYSYGVPANFNFLIKESEDFLKSQIIEEDLRLTEFNDRQRFIRNLNTIKPPKLTREEREQKVLAYLEKKHNRQWKAVRYFHRKRLAEQRERLQGRFVKSQHSRFITLSEEEPLTKSWGSGSNSAGEKKIQKEQGKHIQSLKNTSNH